MTIASMVVQYRYRSARRATRRGLCLAFYKRHPVTREVLTRLVWLPRSQIIEQEFASAGFSAVALPYWLAERLRILPEDGWTTLVEDPVTPIYRDESGREVIRVRRPDPTGD